MNDKEQDLWMASRRYLQGEISIEELKAIEKPFNDAFREAMYVLAKREMSLWRRIRRKK